MKIQEYRKLEQKLPFTPEEKEATVKEWYSFKAPGPDEFSCALVKKAWNILRHDVLNFLQEFHENGKLVKSIDQLYFCCDLIPTVEGVSNFRELRLINMAGCLHKLLSEVLAYRFKKVLPSFVGKPVMLLWCFFWDCF